MIEEKSTDDNYREVLIGMIVDFPVVPSFPELNWNYEEGKYWINEDDVDKLLNYVENDMQTLKWELELYESSVEKVLSVI